MSPMQQDQYPIVENDDINVAALLHFYWTQRRTILLWVLLFTALGTGYAFLAEKKYASTALIYFPPMESDPLGGGGGGIGSALTQYLSPTPASDSKRILGLLESVTLLDQIIAQHDLKKILETNDDAYLRKKLFKWISIEEKESNYFTISFLFKDREKSQAILNTLLSLISDRSIEISNGVVSNKRKFLEQRLADTKVSLDKAERKLIDFQKRNNILEPAMQANPSVNALAQLQLMRIETETQLGIASQLYNTNSAEVSELKMRINEIGKQIKKLSKEKGMGTKKASDEYILPLGLAADVTAQFLGLTRDLKIQEAIFEFLTQQYELSRINEQKAIPSMQIIDPPSLEQKFAKPQRKLVIALSFLGGGLVSLLGLLVQRSLRMQRRKLDEWLKQAT